MMYKQTKCVHNVCCTAHLYFGAPKNSKLLSITYRNIGLCTITPNKVIALKLSFNHKSINKFDSTKIISHFGCTNNIFLKCMYNFTTQNFINKSLSQHKQNKTQLINIKPTIRILTLLLYNFHTKDKNNKLIYFFLPMFRFLTCKKIYSHVSYKLLSQKNQKYIY